jgi:hypothetical protein
MSGDRRIRRLNFQVHTNHQPHCADPKPCFWRPEGCFSGLHVWGTKTCFCASDPQSAVIGICANLSSSYAGDSLPPFITLPSPPLVYIAEKEGLRFCCYTNSGYNTSVLSHRLIFIALTTNSEIVPVYVLHDPPQPSLTTKRII